MKTAILNTLVLIMIFNLIMLIFPEGKTQKFCSISIKTLIMIFILDNIFLSGSLNLNLLNTNEVPAYQREINLSSISQETVDSINNINFSGEEVVNDIRLSFTDKMEINAEVFLKAIKKDEEIDKLRENIAEIFQLNPDNIDFIYGGIYE